MNEHMTEDEVYSKVSNYLGDFYLDVTAVPGTAFPALEHIAKLITKVIVSIASAWWSLHELIDYLTNKNLLEGLLKANG